MNFLAPLFLLGALAVALPVFFHLIRRTAREKLPFSSLMFLMPSPPRVTKRSRLENLFLLLLRCLVLCLLALGFARPYLHKPVAARPEPGRQLKRIILVDTSASMRRDQLWPDARAKAEEFARQTSPADAVALLAFDRQVRPLISFEQWTSAAENERVPLARQRLSEITPGWSSTHLGNALTRAAEMLEDSKSDAPSEQVLRQIVLITDLQEGSRLEGLQGYEWPRGLELIIEPLKAKRPTNAGLQLVTEREDLDPAADAPPTRVRVSNTAESRSEQFQIGWVRPGEKSFSGTPAVVYVPPGQSRIVAAPKPPPDLPAEQLALSGDDHDFDNTVHVVPPKTEVIQVLYLGADSEQDATQPLYYLKRAFLQTRRQNVQILAPPPGAPLGQTNGLEARLMIVTSALPEDRFQEVKQGLAGGKTVFLVLNDLSAAQTLSRLIGTNSLLVEEAAPANYFLLGEIDFQHPLFAPFADPRFSDFTKIHFWKHRRLDADMISGSRVLARFDNRDAALAHIPAGKGAVLVLTSGWHPADSQLALSSKFVPLLYSILEQSGAIKTQLAQYNVGDAVTFPLDSTGPDRAVVIRKPDGAQVRPAQPDPFSETDLPGIYSVTGMPAAFRLAVNVAPEESRTTPLTLEELERLGLPLKHDAAAKPRLTEKRRQHLLAAELENQQKLWRWLMVAAALLLLSETVLAGWLSRRPPAQTLAP